MAAGIVGTQPVGDLEDGRVGAIVLLEADHLGAGIDSLELQNVAQLGSAETINRLVVVADDENRAMRPHERLDQRELNVVGVLEFVDLHVIEPRLVTARATSESSSKSFCVSSSKSSKSTAPRLRSDRW